MTLTSDVTPSADALLPRNPQRWRLSRAGIVNVWHYLDTEFTLTGGRMILRGTNGSGKSRALEMLLPFLLDADRKRMDATGAGKVNLDELMRTAAAGQTNRVGYLWLELSRPDGYLTIGAHIRYSATAHRSEVHFFTTSLRVGEDLRLADEQRIPLSRDELTTLIGADNLTRSPEEHRDTVRDKVFGLRGEAGRDRYTGLLQLLHTLRSPDVGNRIDEGRLPQILSDALPPLSENMLAAAGGRLDLLGETRTAQAELESSLTCVRTFHTVYRKYASDALRATADAAVRAADRAAATAVELDDAVAEAAELDTQVAAADTRLRERKDQLAELERAIRGLESHTLFRNADDLAQRLLTADALGRAADQALAGAARARQHEHAEAERAGEHLDDLATAVTRAAGRLAAAKPILTAAAVPHGALPAELRLQIDRPQVRTEPVRVHREKAPDATQRTAIARARLLPEDCADARIVAEQAAASARRRREQAGRRLGEARRLAVAEHAVRDAESTAERTSSEAEIAAVARDEAAGAFDDAVVALKQHWHEWLTSDLTATLLPALTRDEATLRQRLATVLDGLAGADPTSSDPASALAEFDALPRTSARAVRAEPAASTTAPTPGPDPVRAALVDEQRRLEEDNAVPAVAPWRGTDVGVPLWKAVDFADSLGDDDRAGIEAALLAAGFLTATVDGEGRLRAQSGQSLVSPRGEPPRQPLSTVLRPGPDTTVPQTAITAVLAAIGFEDAGAVASVSRDGRWHNGVLRGRHTQDSARFIGVAARSRAETDRRIRLDEIAAELALLDRRTEQDEGAEAVSARSFADLDEHVAAAPRSDALLPAWHRLRDLDEQARCCATAAADSRVRAAALRARWAADLDAHRSACTHFGLPSEVDELDAAVAACTDAEAECTALARDIGDVLTELERWTRAAERFAQAAQVRVQAEIDAESYWHEWHDKAAVVAAQAEAVDVDVADLADELRHSDTERARTEEQCRRTLALREHLGTTVAEVLQRCSAVRERATRDHEDLAAAAARLSAQLQLPSLSAAAGVRAEPIATLDDPEQVRTCANAVLSALPAPTGTGENRVLAALQRFDREISDRLDVEHTVEAGAQVVRIAGAGENTTPTAVLATLTERVEAGRLALTQRERDVFTGFVLGGVADELRRRIEQAEQLIAAMNHSLAGSRTSHGIGVRIGWRPVREDAGAAQITKLLVDSARSPGENGDLIELLRGRVEASHADDPSAGYAAHLSRALDYRAWHTVEVTIVGPEPDQERRISKRAKISQGETRFVSYVTLFAAADGYLSGLPDTTLALRLVLLDDAFAKIDEPTIGELMGLLVRQDIDFVMTGHALWGCVPQVPALDIYEVRRLDDSSAVTTRVHWDGRSRHVRPGR